MSNSRAEQILSFWFGEIKSPEEYPVEKAKMWFEDGKKFDELIRREYLGDYEKAAAGEYSSWEEDPQSLLALIILLDQFPRNIFRGTARAYATDPAALQLSYKAIKSGMHLKLSYVMRTFVYMPLMHAEILAEQERCVRMFTQLADSVPPSLEIPIRNGLEFAVQHRKIVERFGRFPYRNEELGRASTKEEIEFLADESVSWA